MRMPLSTTFLLYYPKHMGFSDPFSCLRAAALMPALLWRGMRFHSAGALPQVHWRFKPVNWPGWRPRLARGQSGLKAFPVVCLLRQVNSPASQGQGKHIVIGSKNACIYICIDSLCSVFGAMVRGHRRSMVLCEAATLTSMN